MIVYQHIEGKQHQNSKNEIRREDLAKRSEGFGAALRTEGQAWLRGLSLRRLGAQAGTEF